MKINIVLFFCFCGLISATSLANQSGNYIITVQKDRSKNRWTLTDWLQTKAKIRSQNNRVKRDFEVLSDPSTDKFQPESNIDYRLTNGGLRYGNQGEESAKNFAGTQLRLQLWGTNFLTHASGLRMPNVDFGMEHQSWNIGSRERRLAPEDNSSSEDALATATPEFGKRKTQHTTSNFRLFGKSIQDTSVVFKVGQYRTSLEFLDADANIGAKSEWNGMTAALETNIYLFDWFGLSANLQHYGDDVSIMGTEQENGRNYDYGGFFEMALVRFAIGRYQEQWNYLSSDNNELNSLHTGFYGAMRISL